MNMSCEQSQSAPTPVWLVAGALRMAIPSGHVSVHGRALSLTDMECGVLRLLLEGQGRPLGRTAILERLHAGPMPEARIVDVFVCRLRAKLARAGLPGVIGTIWREGYVLRVTPPPPGRHQAVPALARGFAPALRAETGLRLLAR